MSLWKNCGRFDFSEIFFGMICDGGAVFLLLVISRRFTIQEVEVFWLGAAPPPIGA
jgi:hypothetical protein